MSKTYNWENINIIIADDDDINIELLKLILRSTKANISLFSNGQLVLDYLENNSADIIILDIQMPVLGGFETMKKLKEMNFKGSVLALTALSTINELSKYTDYGFNEVIEKPIRKNELLEIICKHIDKYL